MVRFGPFTADLRTGELWRGAERVRIQQQPFRILRALVDRPGQLVSREELIGLLWRDGTFVSFERGLTSALRKVREALGDDAGTHQFIETLPGRGYRFVAPVTFVAESGVTEPPVTCPPRLRAALVLRAMEGREYDEVAEITGVKPATARTHVMQARKLLQRALARWIGRGGPEEDGPR